MAEVQWNAREAVYEFKTASMRGTLMPGGPRMGIQSLVAERSGRDWVLGPAAPGVPQSVATARTRLLGLGLCMSAGTEQACVADLPYEHCLVGPSVVTTFDVPTPTPVAITCRWQFAEPGRVDFVVDAGTAGHVADFSLVCRSCSLVPKGYPSPLVLLGGDDASTMHELHQWLPQGGSGTVRSFAAAASPQKGVSAEPADAVGRPMIVVPDGDQACVSMAHPFDARSMRVFTDEADGRHYLGHDFALFGQGLERGLLFRARVRVQVVDWSDGGEESVLGLARSFGSELL